MSLPRSVRGITPEEIAKVQAKFPTRVIVLVNAHRELDPPLQKYKFLVPPELAFCSLAALVRKRMELHPQDALYFFSGNKMLPMHHTMRQIRRDHADRSGVVRIVYSSENTFG